MIFQITMAIVAVAFSTATAAAEKPADATNTHINIENLPMVAENDACDFSTEDGGHTYVATCGSAVVQVEFVGSYTPPDHNSTYISLKRTSDGRWFHGPDGFGAGQGWWRAE